MFPKRKKGTKQIDSAVSIADSVMQQRSINESLGGAMKLRIIKSHGSLQPMMLNEQRTVLATEKKFGFDQDPTNEYIRKAHRDSQMSELMSFLMHSPEQPLSKPKRTLMPISNDRFQPLALIKTLNESDVSHISKGGGIFSSINGNFSIEQQSQFPYKHVLDGLKHPQPSRASIPSNILKTEESVLNFIDESIVSQADVSLTQSKRFKEIQARLQRELPAIYERVKHLFQLLTMIEAETRDRSGLEQKMNTLCTQVQSVFKIFMNHLVEAESKVTQAQQTIRDGLIKQEQDRKLMKQIAEMLRIKDEQLRLYQDGHSQRSLSIQGQRNNEERLRYVQLEKQLEMSTARIKELSSEGPGGSITDQLTAEIEQLKRKISEVQYQYFEKQSEHDKLVQQMQVMKHHAVKNEKQLQALDEKLQLCEKIVEQIKQHDELVGGMRELKEAAEERAQMAREEMLTVKLNAQEFVRSMGKNIERIKMLQIRIDEMTVKRSKELDAPFESKLGPDRDNLHVVNKLLSQDPVFAKQMMSNFQKNIEIYDMRLLNSMKPPPKKAGEEVVNLHLLRYNYPGFSTFLDKKQLDMEWAHLSNRPLQNIFIGQLRAMMDGMFIQMQISSTSISFQSYVFQWLSNFTIDEPTRKIVAFPHDYPRNKIEEHIITFYLDLHVPRIDKVWEVQQFRHFLSDAYSHEELYFYLQARHMLRRGPWFTSQDGITSMTHYMLADQAFEVLRRFMKDFDEANVALVTRALQERVEKKGDRSLMQTGFVLQLLIEIFHIELHNRYAALQLSFPKLPVTFRHFHRFVKGNYSRATETTVSELWRQINLVTGGHPNMQAFFVVAQDLFIQELQVPSLWRPHASDECNNITYDEQNFAIIQVSEKLQALLPEDMATFEQDILQLGSEHHMRQLRMLRRPRADSPSTVSIVLDLVSLCQVWQRQNCLALQITSNGYADRSPDMSRLLDYIEGVVKESQSARQDQLAAIAYKSLRIARFQRVVRRRLVKFYMIIASALQGAHKDKVDATKPNPKPK